MPPQEKLAQLEAVVQETAVLVQQNNEILKSMQRWDRIMLWARIILWIVVLGLPLLFIGPLLKMIAPAAGVAGSAGFPSLDQLQQTYQQYQDLQK